MGCFLDQLRSISRVGVRRTRVRNEFCHTRNQISERYILPLDDQNSTLAHYTMRLIPLLFGLAALAASSHVIAHEGMSNQANSPAPAGVGVAAGSGGQAVFIPPASTPATGLSLADALTVERRASLWFDYARDVAAVVSVVWSGCLEYGGGDGARANGRRRGR